VRIREIFWLLGESIPRRDVVKSRFFRAKSVAQSRGKPFEYEKLVVDKETPVSGLRKSNFRLRLRFCEGIEFGFIVKFRTVSQPWLRWRLRKRPSRAVSSSDHIPVALRPTLPCLAHHFMSKVLDRMTLFSCLKNRRIAL